MSWSQLREPVLELLCYPIVPVSPPCLLSFLPIYSNDSTTFLPCRTVLIVSPSMFAHLHRRESIYFKTHFFHYLSILFLALRSYYGSPKLILFIIFFTKPSLYFSSHLPAAFSSYKQCQTPPIFYKCISLSAHIQYILKSAKCILNYFS